MRDNGKKFYIQGAVEVDAAFDIEAWDTGAEESAWRLGLNHLAEEHGRSRGMDDDLDLGW